MPDMYWRCKCGQANHPTVLDCVHCDKQRWGHLGVARNAALAMLARLVPSYMVERIVRA